jgi:predicted peptidase
MGGFGTWATAHEFPDMFAGIVPVSGGVSEINQYQAHRFQHLPVWAISQ